jgi:hypothetical protein
MRVAGRAVCILIIVVLIGWMTESRLSRDEPQRSPFDSVVVGHYP